jgi:energy-coupling factor transporter ATP-binding protein EcfA2
MDPAVQTGGMETTIEVSGLRKRFGPVVALNGMTFTVRPGQVTGFVGPNGAGKSTTMRVILGLDAADEGRIRRAVRLHGARPGPGRLPAAPEGRMTAPKGRAADWTGTPKGRAADWTDAPKGRAADWTDAPKGRAAGWTEERGSLRPSDEGRRRVKAARRRKFNTARRRKFNTARRRKFNTARRRKFNTARRRRFNAARAEWTKLRTVPGTVWLLAATIVLTVGVSTAAAAATRCPAGTGCPVDTTKLSLTGVQFGQAVVAILAVLGISSEYSTGMIRTTLTAMPRRLGVLAAKAAVTAGPVLAAGVIAVAGSLLAGLPIRRRDA